MLRWLPRNLSLILLLSTCFTAVSQKWYEPADTLHKKRAVAVGVSEGSLYAGSLIGLQFAWYQEYQSQSFQFYNDWDGWLQMDKVGHSVTAYQTGWNLYKIHRWTGMKERNAIWSAAAVSYSFQLAVEVMDGFSSGWGFSLYDLGFNTIGSAAFVAQQLAWKEQRIKLKFSFTPSDLYDLPDPEGRRARNLFGEQIYEQWLKDYNGQTYWASANVWSLIGKPDRFPKWVNLAVGYSVNNVLGAESNTWELDDGTMYTSYLLQERQLVMSLDIDLDHVNLPPYLLWSRHLFGLIKFPFPAVSWNSEQGFQGHGIYF